MEDAHVFRCQEGRKGGGVSLFLKPSLQFKERHDIEELLKSATEIIAIESKQFIILCIYRPPNCD